jgi:hypothetical protein
MLRTVASKVMWAGKATVFVVGLALIVGLIFGMASAAFGANGQNFILGGLNNTATAITKLTGNVNGSAMQVVNNNPGPNDSALNLSVQPGEAPMRVNSDKVVTNLNADKVDGKDSSEFASASSAPLWAHVNSNGTLVRGNGVQSSGRFSTGYYFVQFNRDVSFCGYVATTTDGYAGPTGTVQGAAYGYPQEVFAYTVAGTARVDLPFHLVVAC